MISILRPRVNYNEIKNSAYLTVNTLKDEGVSKTAETAYRRFLKEGKKAPGYASTIMKTARNDMFLKNTTELLDRNIASEEYNKRCNDIREGLSVLNEKNNKDKQKFDAAGKKMYPGTWETREKILNWYQDNFKTRYPSSRLKELKQDFWGTMERVNPEIKNIREKIQP